MPFETFRIPHSALDAARLPQSAVVAAAATVADADLCPNAYCTTDSPMSLDYV